ncbi:GLPGLI family protein [Sphingobacterium sp. JUb56]|uniref:GLPGLI family protein n=1 Tax=Sphingobacterium sp. JUb56 TaxID=2587145 RepID=UPI0016110CCE|nr:GLPGLI family protein [Sphingobacterium sp. JUb56]MBB2951657.1 GLPGLI family protein [Sphingobacterium sp. JUb56]
MKHFLTCLLATATFSTYSQTADKVLARVRYNFMHLQDTTKKDVIHREEMLLIIGKNASLYTSGLKIAQAQGIKRMLIASNAQHATVMSTTASAASSASTTVGSEIRDIPTLTDYFFFFKEQKFYTKEQIIKQYLVQEDAPKISWTVTNDTTSFSGIHCQKATADFRGRKWVAWYSPELPFQSGPWKLNGLPGLIIEAYDENEEVQFRFAGIENVTAANSMSQEKIKLEAAGIRPEMQLYINEINTYLGDEIKLPEHIIKTDIKQLTKLKKALEKDPEGFFKSQMDFGTADARHKTMPALSFGSGMIKNMKENNPIEKNDPK